MLLSFDWLREFTPYEGSPGDLADRLTMLGLEVEEQFDPFAHLKPLLVGKVVTCQPHPDAQKLSLCEVDIQSGELLPIVCGAPNVQAGQNVAVAPVGTELPGELKIKKSKIRGQVSCGMICSEKELGLGEDSSGIMVLDPELQAGTPLLEALQLENLVFDLGITPNRADCLSVLGIAREVATAYNLPLYLPSVSLQETGTACSSLLSLQIDDPELCPLYQARIIQDISLASSPAWLRYRLLAHNIRPINNIVDITNYVLLELGQPLHAFDQDLIAGQKIRVARSSAGQKFTTLDGQQRTLNGQDLLIWDAQQPVALAGVMGGENSEINSQSRNVLLECAVFNPANIRKTARRLGLSSESSFRFERGVDQPGSQLALDRAADLMSTLAQGKICQGIVKAEPRPWKSPSLTFRPGKARSLLALDLQDDFCSQTLTSLGCSLTPKDNTEWEVIPPSFRLDLEREVDLIEEMARIYGFDRIPSHQPQATQPLEAEEEHKFAFIQKIKHWGQGLGLCESINYSFVGQDELDFLGDDPQSRIFVHNPLSSDQDTMRSILAPGLLQNLRLNLAQGTDSLRLFEVAHKFFAAPDSETTAREDLSLGILLHGRRAPQTWPYGSEEADYQDIKGIIEHLLSSLRLSAAEFELQSGHTFLEPCVRIKVQGREIGFSGMLKPELAEGYNARSPVWMAELDLDTLQDLHEQKDICFNSLPKFPPVRRDMTVVAPLDLNLDQILKSIQELRIDILEDVRLVDVYQPEKSKSRNLTLRMTYRHGQKTLKDKEVDKIHTRLGKSILEALPVSFP